MSLFCFPLSVSLPATLPPPLPDLSEVVGETTRLDAGRLLLAQVARECRNLCFFVVSSKWSRWRFRYSSRAFNCSGVGPCETTMISNIFWLHNIARLCILLHQKCISVFMCEVNVLPWSNDWDTQRGPLNKQDPIFTRTPCKIRPL